MVLWGRLIPLGLAELVGDVLVAAVLGHLDVCVLGYLGVCVLGLLHGHVDLVVCGVEDVVALALLPGLDGLGALLEEVDRLALALYDNGLGGRGTYC